MNQRMSLLAKDSEWLECKLFCSRFYTWTSFNILDDMGKVKLRQSLKRRKSSSDSGQSSLPVN